MDPIDSAILTAFNKLTPKIQQDRLQASARFARTQSPVLTRPHRHACLVIRASDRRINQIAEYLKPDFGPSQHLPHEFTLFGDDIGDLNKSVFVPYPGLPHYDVADLLGMHKQSLAYWVKANVFNTHRVNAMSLGKKGLPILILDTPRPLNPNSPLGQPPHPFFGSIWQYLHQSIPPNFTQSFYRTPQWIPSKNSKRFGGWQFTCPGLLPENPNHKPCGRLVDKLYSPTSTRTLFHTLEIKLHLQLNNQSTWTPGQTDPLLGKRAFACKHCWNLKFTDHSNPTSAWNMMITQLTDGLLYGHEVPIPKNSNLSQRKIPYRSQKFDRHTGPKLEAAKRRHKIIQLLSQPNTQQWSRTQIAHHLHASKRAIKHDLHIIYKQHQVHSRKELLTKLNRATL